MASVAPIRPSGGGGAGGLPHPTGSGGAGGGGIPPEQLVPYIDAQVGKMKVEVKSELERDIAKLPTRAEFFGAIITGLIAAFGIFAIMGDRIEHAVDSSTALTATLDRLATQGDANAKALEALKNGKSDAPNSAKIGKDRPVHS